MDPKSENWLKIAEYDLRTAEANLKSNMHIASVEKCHNALEKLLKGIIASHDQTPTKIHDLLKLSAEAVIDNLQEEVKRLFIELNDYYMLTRYPYDFDVVEKELTGEKVREILNKAKEVFKWLKKNLQ